MNINSDIETFLRDGYLILDLFDEAWVKTAEQMIHDRVDEIRAGKNSGAENADWSLAEYHKSLGARDEDHRALMAHSVRYINLTDDMVEGLLPPLVLSLLDHYWGHREPMITHRGHELREEDEGKYACGYRFVRPGLTDVAGVHVDTYFGSKPDAYDESLETCVHSADKDAELLTIWIPVVGFDERYSLRIAPRTHMVEHPVDAFNRDPGIITQAVKDDYESKFDYIRPGLKPGQAILFHPNLMHGGSSNLGDSTRVSMEVRLHNPKRGQSGD